MKTYKQEIGEILKNLQPHQKVILGTANPIFIEMIISIAKAHPNDVFYIPFSSTGRAPVIKNAEQVARLYAAYEFPDNVLFDEGFAQLVKEVKIITSN